MYSADSACSLRGMADQLRDETSVLLEECLQHYVSSLNEPARSPAAQTLRTLVRDVLAANRSAIESSYVRMNADPRGILRSVAAQMPLEGGLNWGRVVSLIAFAAFLTEERGDRTAGTPKELAEVLTQFLAVEHRDWLDMNGGWDGFCKFFSKRSNAQAQENSTISSALMAAAGFGLAGLAFLLVVR